MLPERRHTRQAVSNSRVLTRAEGDEKKPRVIGGYGAVFYNPADPGTEIELWTNTFERIMPGAFDNALKDYGGVVSCFNHDANFVLGRGAANTLKLSIDAKGLIYEVTENLNSHQWNDVAESVQRGDVTGASFMFWPTVTTWRDEEDGRSIRELVEIELLEVGPVTFPWYPSATAGMRIDAEHVGELRKVAEASLHQRSAAIAARRRREIDFRWRQVQQSAASREG